ncbi:DsbA family oxidoreductase [Chitinophaga horti]|uniref:DsbA family oxidoreductase n=1 Tax=Chitinophaga horti TaxID=2920382 RepID=A0ABY6J1V4_9BACT|nr:DsbA family oxidoreductase [Chitinophaga horti]UYQ93653.1 DsbA family oxidoreductase [Chitinophaga horti]
MKVEIWSDIMCPFCYIGKRRFEQALEHAGITEPVEVVWKSFQLDPHLEYVPGRTTHEMLAEKKGWTTDYAKDVSNQVSGMAAQLGLQYDFDKAVPANTLDAHRLSHLAAKHGVQNEVEEQLFSAYFTEGKNVGDAETLVQIGAKAGIPEAETRNMLAGDTYQQEVSKDIAEGASLGVRGVPFFVFNRQYAISGAQPLEVFTQTFHKVLEEEKSAGNETAGAVCTPDGDC